MKKLVCFSFFAALFFFAAPADAQNFKSAVGARLGYPVSATFKHFLNESNAVEVYAGFRGWSTYSWFTLSGAYQVHKPLEDVTKGLEWYFGGGASVYFWNYDFSTEFSTTTLGLQGYLGLQYTFEDTPINLSVDWIPTVFIGNGFTSGFGGGYGSLAVRYVLSRP